MTSPSSVPAASGENASWLKSPVRRLLSWRLKITAKKIILRASAAASLMWAGGRRDGGSYMLSPVRTWRRGALFALALAAACLFTGANVGSAFADPPAATTEDVATDYRLGPGDQLRITVFGEPDLTGTYQVGSQGSIAYPLVGEVQANGLTIPDFTDRLRTALLTYIRAPNVSVEVANYRPFFILGEVQHPGTYPYSASLTVQNAVATAGGFTYRANKGRVFIRHANEQDEHPYRLTTSTPVMPGDTVRIGERFF